jgi:hypothetical protein
MVTYGLFCEKFVSCVIGPQSFKKLSLVKPFSQYCEKGDEAMTFLIMANNWHIWVKIAEDKKREAGSKKVTEYDVKQRYFVDRKGRGHSWSDEGREFFNERYESVAEDRKQYGKAFDADFLKRMNGEYDVDVKRKQAKRKKTNVSQVRRVKCHSDVKSTNIVVNVRINKRPVGKKGRIEVNSDEE